MSFNNKVVLVTGAASGIGAAIAKAFAKEGANVVIVDRNEKKISEFEHESNLRSYEKPPLIIKADVSIDDDAKKIVQMIIDKFGKLDILVNNAGIGDLGCITDGKLIESYDKVFATNLRAPMLLTMLASPYLINTKGNIINISSIGSQYSPVIPQMLSYCASKAGLNRFTVGSAHELAPYGVRVNTVSPGPVYSNILESSKNPQNWDTFKKKTALDRVSEPDEIADLVLFLASDKAKGVTGVNYVSDNGMLLKV